MKKLLTIASLLFALTLSLIAFGGIATEAKAEAPVTVTVEDMIANKDKLLPEFNYTGAARLAVNNGVISSWEHGGFYYAEEVDGVEFNITLTAGTDICFALRTTASGSMWSGGKGYYLYVSGQNIELYEVADPTPTGWNNKKIANTGIDANIFDGNTHYVKFVIDEANDKFVVAIDSQSFDVPYPDEFLPKEGTNFKIARVNSGALYTVSANKATEPDEPDVPEVAGIALTEETMLANPNKLLPAFNYGGTARLSVANGQISSWTDGNFYYNDLVDSVSFNFSTSKGSTQTMLFVGLHISGPGVPWASTGYYAFVDGQTVGLYRIDSGKLGSWESGLVGQKVTASANIFDGSVHNIFFGVSGKTLTVGIDTESVSFEFTEDTIPVENTELSINANGGHVFLVGKPAVVEKDYTGEYTNIEEFIKSGAIRPDYNFDSEANEFFCKKENGFVYSNEVKMSVSADVVAIDFDIVVTAGKSMAFVIRATSGGDIWSTGGYAFWFDGNESKIKLFDSSEKWLNAPAKTYDFINIFDGKQHNIKAYAFDDNGVAQIGLSVDGGSFMKYIDNTAPVSMENHTEFYLKSVNDDTVRFKVTAPAGTQHAYGEPVVVAPTCTEGGYTVTTCADCLKAVVTDEQAAIGHNYVADVTAPGCITEGYTTYTCSNCNDSYVADEVDAVGHSYTEVVTAPTCTSKGYTTHTCSGCGDSYEDTYVAMVDHSFVAGEVVAPTCTAKGYTVYECENCEATENRDETEIIDHSFVAGEVVAPTCTAKGYTVYECENCEATENRDETEMVEHEFEEASRTEPTSEAEGEIVYKCKNCEETKTEAIPVLTSSCFASVGIDLGVISVALGAVAMFFARKTKKD